jgi:acyl-homoserine lactone synthase
MYEIITPEDRIASRDQLEEMYRHRYEVVVDQWGWDVPGLVPGRDVDKFDIAETVYIIVRDAAGTLTASTRLNPTTGAHMMTELFTEFCDLQPIPRGEDVLECSRFVVDRKKFSDPVSEYRARAALAIAITEFGLANGIKRFTWLTHRLLYNTASKAWRTEPLGLPKRSPFDRWDWIAAVSEITEAALNYQLDRYENAENLIRGSSRMDALKKREAA